MKPKHTGRGSSGGGFSVMDLVIIIVVGAVTFGTIFGWVHETITGKEPPEQGDNCIVTFRIDETHREVLEGLAVGDPIYFVDDDSFLGYLRDDLESTDIAGKPSFLNHVNGRGSMLCVGKESNRTLTMGNRTITPGDVLVVRTEREQLTIHIVEITKTAKTTAADTAGDAA